MSVESPTKGESVWMSLMRFLFAHSLQHERLGAGSQNPGRINRHYHNGHGGLPCANRNDHYRDGARGTGEVISTFRADLKPRIRCGTLGIRF